MLICSYVMINDTGVKSINKTQKEENNLRIKIKKPLKRFASGALKLLYLFSLNLLMRSLRLSAMCSRPEALSARWSDVVFTSFETEAMELISC